MPPKGRRSISPWYTCEVCHIILTYKDLPLHQETSCPPSSQNWTHGYIRNKILYSTVDVLTSEELLKRVSKLECVRLVFLSHSALQLCEIPIGSPVVVTLRGEPRVRIAWPTSEKSLVSVLMTEEAIEQSWVSSEGCVTVQRLCKAPLPAKEVIFQQITSWDVPSDAASYLQHKYREHILCEGEKLRLCHFGRMLVFKVQKIINYDLPDGADSVISDAMKEMSLVNENKISCSKIVCTTKWIMAETNEVSTKPAKDVDLETNIGGLDIVISELRDIVSLALKRTALVPGMQVPKGVLLYGPPGTGKTLLANAIAAESKAFVLRIQGPELYSKYFGETEAKLKSLFKQAEDKAPSIVLCDEMDVLCPKRGSSGGSEQDQRVVATLLTVLDSLQNAAVMVLATSNKPDSIDPALRRPGRLDHEIEVGVPSPNDRLDILRKLLAQMPHSLSDQHICSVAHSAHGFVGADLTSLCSRAAMQAMKEAPKTGGMLTVANVAWALTQVKPSAMREVLVEVPNVRWSDIGGQHELKLRLRQAVEWPLKHPEAFTRLGIQPPRGVLMFGPPGCSKTMIAKALATESHLNFLSVKGPELFSKWVGESERAVRAVFRRARQVAPAIVFFDELDALGGERSGSSASSGSNVQERVLAQLLTELDGVEPLGNVTIVGATNRPDRIDKALLRPGRFDRIVYVPLPDADTRREILLLQLSRTPTDHDVDVEDLVQRTGGYSGAEVIAMCHEAALKALEEDLTAAKVTSSHFSSALNIVTPRTPAALLDLYERYIDS